MSDEVAIGWLMLLLLGAFVAGALTEHYSHKRRILPPPRRMTK